MFKDNIIQKKGNVLTPVRDQTAYSTARCTVKKSSPICNLDPLVDGLLRVGGQLQHAQLDEDHKHPVILPKDHRVTRLIMRHYHHIYGHSGRNYVLSMLRKKFWTTEYLPLIHTQKWNQPRRDFRAGDIVLVGQENSPRNSWPMGMIFETISGRDNKVHRVKIKSRGSVYDRPIDKCVLLEGDNPEADSNVESG